MTRWGALLDEYEARLDAAEHATADEAAGPPVAEFVAPTVIEPLPEELRPRAQALLDRGNELQTALAAEVDRIRRDLHRLPRRDMRRQGVGRFEFEA